MSDVIRLLPDSVANQIAAGEVIQRPASVIKELVENAVDAGATEISVFIRDAGRTLIQVVDNGRGMSVSDARMAFERHATSKISQAADLFTLHTMGFRGEALPSICAIAQIELKTRTQDDNIGTRLVINGSKVECQEPCVCEKGTNIMVKNLFFNVPARRKFLKSDNVELANIMREFERLALVNNAVKMTLDRGTGKPLELRPGNFKQRIGDIWKNNLNLQLLPVDVDTSLVKISGFISRPEHARRRNALQYLIVNGRNMRHPYFHRAILSCFDGLIPSDAQPCYFIRFDVDPETIDVNIHPTKNEIKFENEAQIWPILTAAVRAALGKFAAVPSIDFTADVLPVEPVRDGMAPEAPRVDVPENYNPFERYSGATAKSPVGHRQPSKAWQPTVQSSNWESLYDSFMRQAGEKAADMEAQAAAERPELPLDEEVREENPLCVQFALKYIIAPSREGLLVIDQYRAHVKILYERIMSGSFGADNASQQVMFPESISIGPSRQAALRDVEPQLVRLGFRIEYTEGETWQISAVPSMLKGESPSQLIEAILDSVCDDSESYGREGSAADRLLSKVALLTARSAAIKRGVRLGTIEMEHIVSELFSLPAPGLTPDGNPTYRLLDESAVAKMF